MVKYAPRKVYIRESGGYVELSYTEFCRCRESDQTYMDKLFIPIQGCLLEVVREQYTDFYRDKERWRYLQKLDTKNRLLSLDGFTDSEVNPLDFITDEAVDIAETVVKWNNLAFHLIQSFEPGEVDYQKAHEIGKQLADAVTKGQHEYVLTTHIDKGHVHNHIIFCAVNFVDHHKYNSNKRSYYGIRNMSDKLCRENGLSVVVPGKGSKGKSYAEYQAEKTGTSWKGKLKTTVDALIPQVSSFEELLTRLQAAGYEIKPGKYVSCRAHGQERFTRLKTLGADYTEEAVRERIAGRRTKVAKAPREQRGVSLLIDIENSIKAAQSKGYEQWAKIHNLKQAAKTMNFLTEHKIEQYADLVSRIEEMAAESGQAADALKNAEKRLAEMAVLIKNVSTYQKTKPVYDAYRKARNREKYRAGQEQAIILHEAAVRSLKAAGIAKLPNLAALQSEYEALQAQKEALYADYGKLKKKVREYDIIKQNIDSILQADRQPEREKETERG